MMEILQASAFSFFNIWKISCSTKIWGKNIHCAGSSKPANLIKSTLNDTATCEGLGS